MKKLFLNMMVLTLAVGLISCGDKKEATKDATRTSGGGRGDNNGATTPLAAAMAGYTGIWGVVTLQSASLTENGQTTGVLNPNDVARGFLSTNWPWQVIGATTTQADPNFSSDVYKQQPCIQNQNCQVQLALGVDNGSSHSSMTTSSNQTISQIVSSGQKVNVTGGGITLGFWDSFAGTSPPDQNGNTSVMYPIPVWVPVDTQNSYIQGSKVLLAFQDGLGSVVVSGTVSGNIISGTISFVNKGDYTGGNTTLSGNLGNFTMNVCAAFKCQ